MFTFKIESINKYLRKLTNNRDYSLWKAIKKLKRQTFYMPSVKEETGQD